MISTNLRPGRARAGLYTSLGRARQGAGPDRRAARQPRGSSGAQTACRRAGLRPCGLTAFVCLPRTPAG